MNNIVTGLIIGARNRGDANRVIELLTPENGTEYFFASGARRLTSRFLPLTKLFAIVSLECVRNGTMYVIKDGNVLGGFRNIETDPDKFCIASGIVSNIRIAAANSDNKSKLYALCVAFFDLLDKCESGNVKRQTSAAVKFYIYMLCYLGYDVKTYADTYKGGRELADICEYLSGKRISVAMSENEELDGACEAYKILSHIYADQLDMKLGELTMSGDDAINVNNV